MPRGSPKGDAMKISPKAIASIWGNQDLCHTLLRHKPLGYNLEAKET